MLLGRTVFAELMTHVSPRKFRTCVERYDGDYKASRFSCWDQLVRGMRIRVTDVLEMFAAGLDLQQVLEELADFEADDICACLQYASRRLDHPIIAA